MTFHFQFFSFFIDLCRQILLFFSINYCLVPNSAYIRNADSETCEFFCMLTHNIAALVMQLKYSIYHIETFFNLKYLAIIS